MIDKSMNKKPVLRYLIALVAIGMSVFHIYTAAFGTLEATKQREVHLLFVLVLVFLVFPIKGGDKRKWLRIWDFLLIGLSLLSVGFLILNHQYFLGIRMYYITPLTTIETLISLLLIVLVLETTRRVTGIALPIVAAFCLAYVWFGKYVPGKLGHNGFSLDFLLDHLVLTPNGIWGVALGVSATYIYMFLMFGTFLQATGFGKFLLNVSLAAFGKSRGGPAKVAVFSSALFGMMSGSAVANVATTGNFTIPLMKNLGFKPNFAGAVEAAASCGGQLMPPIMASVALLMVEFTGISYITIIKHATLPAVLYFLAIYFAVDLRAGRMNLGGMDIPIPSAKKEFIKRGYLGIPVILLLVMLGKGYTIMLSTTLATLLTVLLSLLKRETRLSLTGFLNGLETTANSALAVATACATAGIVIGVISLTSVGNGITSLLLDATGTNLLLGVIAAMIAGLILGMGLPTNPAYIVQVALLIPALRAMGLSVLTAHFFILYYSCISLITPPVAIASYTAASIAGADSMKTAWQASRLAVVGYIIPLMFVYDPALLLVGSFTQLLLAVPTAIIGVYCLSLASEGYWHQLLTLLERMMMLVGGLTLIYPGIATDLIGTGMFALAYFFHRRRHLPAISKNTADTISIERR